jgi:RHS repeat-associated protein
MASQLRADAAYTFRAGLLGLLAQAVGDRTPRPQQEKQRDRDARVSRIEISPGDVTLQVGQRMTFAATAFDAAGEPVGGVHVRWKAKEVGGRKQNKRVSNTGVFVSAVEGEFTVTAEADKAQAEVKVKVVNETGVRGAYTGQPKPDEKPTSTREVSTRDAPKEVSANAKKDANGRAAKRARRGGGASNVSFVKASYTPAAEPAAAAAEPAAAYLVAGQEWDDSNYMAADDPGNVRGDPPGQPAELGAGSGNFQMTAPVLDLPGRAIELKLALTYNSQVWSKSGSTISYDLDQDWPAPGWSLGFGRLIKMGNSGSMIVDADGTRHGYTGTMNNYSWGSYFTGYTTDSTFIDYTHSANSNGVITYASARYPNGMTVQYGAPGRNAVYPTQITDANGNYITITYVNNQGPNIQTVTDTLGRTVNFHYDYYGLLTAVTGPGLGGGTRTLVRLHYRWLTLGYYFYGMTAQVRSQTVPVVDAIYYPATRTGFWFGDSDSYSSYGMIAKVQEQRSMGFSAGSLNEQGSVWAGTVTNQKLFNYPMSTASGYLTAPPSYTTQTETWAGMDTAPAVTTYSVQQNTSPRSITVTQPDGTRSVNYSYNAPNTWYDGLTYQDDLYDANGRLWRRTTVSWQQGAYGSVRPVRNETTDELGQVTAQEFSYGAQYNQVTEVRSYGYGGYEPLSRTVFEYDNSYNYTGRHIYSLVTSVTVYDRDWYTRLSRTEYQYDAPGSSLAATPGVVMHDTTHDPYAPQYWVDEYCYYDCYDYGYNCYYHCDPGYWQTDYNPSTDYRGNVTRVTRYSDAAGLTGAVVETRGYDVAGNVVRSSSSCCEEVRDAYAVDTQYAYPASNSRGSSDPNSSVRVTTRATYDFNTGLLLTSTDANGRVSSVEYAADSLRPTFGRLSTGAYTAYAYNDDQTTITETLYHYGGAAASSSVKTFNGRGQIRLDQSLAPGGVWDAVETKYDQFGRVWKQSAPYRSGDTPQWTENFYDAIGRGTKAVGADGSVVETFYNESSRPPGASYEQGVTKRTVDAWGRERWERTDATGHIVEVAEPDAAGNGSVLAAGAQITRYRYDSLGNLVEVTQGSQQRRFRYDALGRMTHQKLAEAAATLNDAGQYVGAGTWSHVFGYDDRNLVWQVDARGARTTYAYDNDPLNRIKTISYSTAGVGDTSSPVEAAPTVRYEYATTGDLTRLARVVADGVSTEDFAYDGEGRPFRKTLTLASRPGYPMAVEYTYNSINKITDVRYPSQYGAGGATKYVHYDFDVAGRLTALNVNGASFGSQATYNAESQLTSLLVGSAGYNQVQETYAYSNQTGLMTGQRIVRNGAALLDLSYDHWGAASRYGRTGQIKRITNNLNSSKSRTFDYDALGRLVKASNGSTWTERYTYDRYGNRTSVTSSAGLASAPAAAQDSGVQLAYNGGRDELPAFARREAALSVSDAAPLSPLALARPPQAPLPASGARARDAGPAAKGTAQSAPERNTLAAAQTQQPTAKPTPTPAPAPEQQTDQQAPEANYIEPCQPYQAQDEFSSQLASDCGGNMAPWAEPQGPYSGQVNQAIQFDGSWSYDDDGYITNYSWTFGDGTTSTLMQPTKAYAAAGTYTVTLRVRDNSGLWSTTRSTTATVSSPTPVNGATFISQSVPSAMNAGQQYIVSVTMRNTGTKTWTAADQHRLGSQNPQDNGTWGIARVGVPATVAPGSDATFTFNVTAPASPGTYYFQWRMLQEGVEWFGDYTANVAVTVTQPAAGGCSGPAPCDGHPTVSYDPGSNRVNSPGWLYDAAGNQIRAPRADGSAWQRYVYDAAGRLVRVKNDYGTTILIYKYGASNERLVTQEGGDASNQRTYHVWDSGKVLAEFGETNAAPYAPGWLKNYYYMGSRLLATQEASAGTEVVNYHHPDHLGTRLVTNQASGAVVEQANLPFGNAMSSESTGGTTRRFTSYERNATTGLDYALNRHYDPGQGRFTQVDPLGLRASNISDPQTLNLYAYCGNDPVNHTDPDGLFFGKLFKGIGKLFKGIAKAVGKVLNIVGKALSYVGTLMAKVLHNRWFVLGITLLSIIFPPVWVIYQAASKLSFILQAAGLALQGKWKELIITIAQAAIQWAINKVLTFVLDKIHMAMGILQRLSECAKNALSGVFERTLLDRIKIYTVRWLWAHADAWTFGNNQYYLEGQYDERTSPGLALIGHETTHSRDFAALGMFRFIFQYIRASLRFDYFSKDHPFEQPARDVQDSLAGAVRGCAGGNNNVR